jgi:hypothetical protein
MSLADKKQVLLHIVEDADEKLTGLLIALANEYNSGLQFTDEEVAFFKNRKKEFYDGGKNGYSVEEAHRLIRSRKHNEL